MGIRKIREAIRLKGGLCGTSTQEARVCTITSDPQQHRIRDDKNCYKGGVSNSTRIPKNSGAHTSITPDAIIWAKTWELMNRTSEALATRNRETIIRGEGISRMTFKKPKEYRDDSDGCIDTWVEVKETIS